MVSNSIERNRYRGSVVQDGKWRKASDAGRCLWQWWKVKKSAGARSSGNEKGAGVVECSVLKEINNCGAVGVRGI